MARIWRKSSAEEYNETVEKADRELFHVKVNTLSKGTCFYCEKSFRLTKGYWVFLTSPTLESNMLGMLGYWVCCSEECFNICVLTNKSDFFV